MSALEMFGVQTPKIERWQNEWEKLKSGSPFFALQKGREIDVSASELELYARNIVEENKNKEPNFTFRFILNIKNKLGLDVVTDEELKTIGEQAYQLLLNKKNFDSAMEVAREVYGEDSPEYCQALKASQQPKSEQQKNKKTEITLSKDATFTDLFTAQEDIEKDLGEIYFEEELWDNFDPTLAKAVLSFRDEKKDKASTTKVADFFREHGYTQSEISSFLPIKFRREKKQKKA